MATRLRHPLINRPNDEPIGSSRHLNHTNQNNGGTQVRRFWKLAAVTALAVIVGPVMAAMPAGASGPTGYGFDDTPHVVVGGGSDTTWKVMTALTALYNTSAGCTNHLVVNTDLNTCLTDANPDPWGTASPYLGNWQHDTIAQAYPAGSSAGITA